MKKTKKHLEAALAEADARIDRLRDELTTTRRLNDELRETLGRVIKERDSFSERLSALDRHSEKQDHRLAFSFNTSAVERRNWQELLSAEFANRAQSVTLVKELRRSLKEALRNITQLQKRARTLNQNRVDCGDGVYVKASDLIELTYASGQIDHFVEGTEVEHLLEVSGSDSSDE